jgi:hypothetical protein
MEVLMELMKKTTILFSPQQHTLLTQLARQRGVSLGQIVREACEAQYGAAAPETRLKAVKALGELELPVTDVATMKRESVPRPKGDFL